MTMFLMASKPANHGKVFNGIFYATMQTLGDGVAHKVQGLYRSSESTERVQLDDQGNVVVMIVSIQRGRSMLIGIAKPNAQPHTNE
jgi:hypothetical protein